MLTAVWPADELHHILERADHSPAPVDSDLRPSETVSLLRERAFDAQQALPTGERE
jgi:hypothetical protein